MPARIVLLWRGVTDGPRHVQGNIREDVACEELSRRRYAILERGYRTRFGEIDIIARDGDTTVFVEVKTRAGDGFGEGAEAVTPWKQRRIALMAVDYASRCNLHDSPCRFDVVTVDLGGGTPVVEVYEHAFELP